MCLHLKEISPRIFSKTLFKKKLIAIHEQILDIITNS